MDQAGLEYRLTEILARILSEGANASPRSAAELNPSEEFAVLGVNSVDLMEFVLRVEQDLNLDVLQDMSPDQLPSTIRGWAEFIYPRLEQSTRS